MKWSLNAVVARVLKRLHSLLDVILMCMRWHVAYPLSLHHLEEMMAKRGISVDRSIGTPMGHQTVACAGECVSTLPPGWKELADGRECVTNTSESLWCCYYRDRNLRDLCVIEASFLPLCLV